MLFITSYTVHISAQAQTYGRYLFHTRLFIEVRGIMKCLNNAVCSIFNNLFA